jgi:hypothetical protein
MRTTQIIACKDDAEQAIFSMFKENEIEPITNDIRDIFLSIHASPHMLWMTLLDTHSRLQNQLSLYKSIIFIGECALDPKLGNKQNWIDCLSSMVELEHKDEFIAYLKNTDITAFNNRVKEELNKLQIVGFPIFNYLNTMLVRAKNGVIYQNAVSVECPDVCANKWYLCWAVEVFMDYFDTYTSSISLVDKVDAILKDSNAVILKMQ